MASNSKMILGMFAESLGSHSAAWRRKEVPGDITVNFETLSELVQTAEKAKLHYAFVADSLTMRDWPIDAYCRTAHYTQYLEPITAMSALAAVTSKIGLVATASTAFVEPYTMARQFASMDSISGGRAAWNIVTSLSENEALAHGRDSLAKHGERYKQATEYVEIVKGLWNSSQPGVFLNDKEAGVFIDESKLSRYRYEGDYHKTDATFNVPTSPQGRPVLVQAGSSGPGRELAASVGELLFALTPTKEIGIEYRSDIRKRAAAMGRNPDNIKVVPGFLPVIGDSEAEAREIVEALNELIQPAVSRAYLADMMGNVDLSGYSLDDPLPQDILETNKSRGYLEIIYKVAGDRNMSMRQITNFLSVCAAHYRVFGTPEMIADGMQEFFEAGACDGFMIFGLYPGEFQKFTEQVVPILQNRGLFHQDYKGNTFRENLFV